MREIKFRVHCVNGDIHSDVFVGNSGFNKKMKVVRDGYEAIYHIHNVKAVSQFTGLTDKNGNGSKEVYECDIIDAHGEIIGNTHEMDARETDIVIPRMGTKSWQLAYEKAMDRGFDFAE